MIRLKREQYAVGTAERNGVSVTVGIYYGVPVTEDVEELSHTARRFGREALTIWGGNHVKVVEAVQEMMDFSYPDRPFYVETDENNVGVQVYQPYGMPQDGTSPKRFGRLPEHES